MKFGLTIVSIVLLASAAFADGPPKPGDDDGMGGDVAGTAKAEVIDWFPVIRSFYVESVVKNSNAEIKKVSFVPYTTDALPSEQLQWEALKQTVERKAADGTFPPYDAEKPIVCGWKYLVDKDAGTTSYQIETAKPGEPIIVMLRDTEARFTVNFDVIMTTDPDKKREYLMKYLHFVKQETSIWPVKANMEAAKNNAVSKEALAAYCAPVDATPTQYLVNYDGTNEVIPRPVADADGNLSFLPNWSFNSPGTGVWEIRVKYVVSGKLPGQEKETVKDIQSAIRVAFLDNTQWDFGKLAQDRAHRTTNIPISKSK